jgi:hypothetical protein
MPIHTVPHPVLILVAAVFLWLAVGVTISALRSLKHFSLRTLLIVVTVVAVCLGLAAVMLRVS